MPPSVVDASCLSDRPRAAPLPGRWPLRQTLLWPRRVIPVPPSDIASRGGRLPWHVLCDGIDADPDGRQANTAVRLTVVTIFGLVGTVTTGFPGGREDAS